MLMQEMTCLIPAAGSGLRAMPQTAEQAKCMLLVQSRPILYHLITMVRTQLGITRFLVVTGVHGKSIRRYFQDGTKLGVAIDYIENTDLEKGLTWSIYLGREKIKSPFLLMLGDEYYHNSNHHLLCDLSLDGVLVTCGVIQGKSIKEIQQNYSVQVRGNKVTSLVEKPQQQEEDLMGTGTFVCSPELFTCIEKYFAETGKETVDFITLLDLLIKKGRVVRAFELAGGYVNINDFQALEKANAVARA